jgi:hypothetical protein
MLSVRRPNDACGLAGLRDLGPRKWSATTDPGDGNTTEWDG